jgi:hypothetical protein
MNNRRITRSEGTRRRRRKIDGRRRWIKLIILFQRQTRSHSIKGRNRRREREDERREVKEKGEELKGREIFGICSHGRDEEQFDWV